MKLFVVVRVFFLCCFCLSILNLKAQQNVVIKPEELLPQLIKFESLSGNEKPLGIFLSDYCNAHGFKTQFFSKNDSSFNFTASLYPLSLNKPNIVFLSHLDVVPASSTGEWTHLPFSGDTADGYVWGRGAIDCKGLAAMQIAAMGNLLQLAKEKDLPYNVTFLAVSGEEEGSAHNGSDFVVSHYKKELNAIALFGEGGSGLVNFVDSKPEQVVFGISVAEKKALWLKLEAINKTSGHGASAPELYANKRLIRALIKLLDEKRLVKFNKLTRSMFKEMGKLEGGLKGFIIKHIYWDVFWPLVSRYFDEGELLNLLVYNTFVITNLYNQNIVSNQIADKAYAVLDCRLLPETDVDKFIKKVENVVGNKINVSIISQSPGAEMTDTKTKAYTTFSDVLQQVYPSSKVLPILFPGTTDNNYFRQIGIPVYGIIPVIFKQDLIESVHNVNERILIEQLQKGTEVYKQFLIKMNTTP